MTTQESPSTHANVVPSEVGWQFVPQYYTFVNKHPQRLHCFYTKTSTFIHGTEGEEVTACHGQQEIHNKITSIGFEDCKVFIHSVDAQSSANGGIIIQVIGEMANHGDPWRKFVQTFFLAEQPNGYFVLNDIFRFLKEEAVEGDDASEHEAEPAAAAEEFTPAPAAPAPQTVTPAPAPVPVEHPASPAEPTVSLPSAEIPKPNGIHVVEPEPEPVPAPSVPVAEATPAPTPQVAPSSPSPSPSPAPPSPAPPAPAPAISPAPPPAAAQPSPQPPSTQLPPAPAAAPVAAAPAPAPVPAAPKTWAHLAAANSKKWGAAVATESRGTSEVPVGSSSPHSGAVTPTSSVPPVRGPQHSQHGRQEHPAYISAQSVTTPQCFVKGVIETVSNTALTNALTNRFGPVKDVEIVRSKACAFLEFTTLEAAKKAIIASLPAAAGGEGGVRIDVGGGDTVRIVVETKKERGERPVSRPRGGAPINGEARGGFRGRGGPGGRGRGAPNK